MSPLVLRKTTARKRVRFVAANTPESSVASTPNPRSAPIRWMAAIPFEMDVCRYIVVFENTMIRKLSNGSAALEAGLMVCKRIGLTSASVMHRISRVILRAGSC